THRRSNVPAEHSNQVSGLTGSVHTDRDGRVGWCSPVGDRVRQHRGRQPVAITCPAVASWTNHGPPWTATRPPTLLMTMTGSKSSTPSPSSPSARLLPRRYYPRPVTGHDALAERARALPAAPPRA